MSRRFFTLLELMIAIAILGLASSAIAWKMGKAVERKKFSSSLDRLKSSLIETRQLALNMQADWEGILSLEKGDWIFEAKCINGKKTKKPAPLRLSSFTLFWNREKKERVEFLFTSNGIVLIGKDSDGVFSFSKKTSQVEWPLPSLFGQEESRDGKKIGPLHPAEIVN